MNEPDDFDPYDFENEFEAPTLRDELSEETRLRRNTDAALKREVGELRKLLEGAVENLDIVLDAVAEVSPLVAGLRQGLKQAYDERFRMIDNAKVATERLTDLGAYIEQTQSLDTSTMLALIAAARDGLRA